MPLSTDQVQLRLQLRLRNLQTRVTPEIKKIKKKKEFPWIRGRAKGNRSRLGTTLRGFGTPDDLAICHLCWGKPGVGSCMSGYVCGVYSGFNRNDSPGGYVVAGGCD
jgi:hypothetical protein